MANCDGISLNADYSCDTPPIAGVEERLVLMNFKDIASFAVQGANPSIIEGFTLKSGKQAFSFQGVRNSLVPEQHYAPGRFSPSSYEHMVNFLVWDFAQAQKDNLEAMAIEKQVAIVQNADKTFDVYGIRNGLEVTTNDRLPGDQDTGGGYQIVLKTSENEAKEPKLPRTFFKTDFATTLDLVDDLLNFPIIFNIAPITGMTAGGDTFTVTGKNFFNTLTVPVADVTSLDWVDSLLAVTNQAAFVVDSDTQISIASSVALSAETYGIRVTTSAGVATGEKIVVIS